MTNLQLLEHCYWKIRAALQVADRQLQSPHPLWAELNELIELVMTLELELNVANGYRHGLQP